MAISSAKQVKRFVDLTLSLTGFFILSPLMVIIALYLRFIQKGPVFFKQMRPGLMGRPFKLYKFRTMTNNLDAMGHLLPDADRLTGFGRKLRATSLDELPELINIIKGDMSIVGPRPLLMQYLDRYSLEQERRHEVKPGLTGWAQVNGRNAISWDEKFKLDVWYVDNMSLGLDLRIILLTIMQVLKGKDICHTGEATMSEFMGKVEQNGSR